MPLISVIIPTRNRRAVLDRALQSVLIQTFKEYEVIVVDDGSEDGTGDLALLHRPEVRLIQLPLTRGVSAARNTGACHARGHYLAFLDSDDQWHPRKLEYQLSYMKARPEFVISQTEEVWIRNGVRVNVPRVYQKREGSIFFESLERCTITPSSVMIEKRVFDRAGGFNEAIAACEDYDLWLRLTGTYSVGLVAKPLLIRHGGHPDQLSRTTAVPDRFRIRALLDILSRGALDDLQRQAAQDVLVAKALILANGYRKRGKEREYERYLAIARYGGFRGGTHSQTHDNTVSDGAV